MTYVAVGLYLVLQLVSRVCEGRQGVKFTLKAAPFTQEWELFDWLPHWTANQWDTGDEGQAIVRNYYSFALHGEILCFRWTINGSRFLYEMTRAEADRLQKIQPVITYDDHGGEIVKNPKTLDEYKRLHAEVTRRGRTVRIA